ncbi:hypothetical protein D9757_003972 [Collybiopsis confluens]|uniref:Serine hydrolase domain-containing protein n=1 Tax=Collybiopsis confluens TaxID=2823264 RepID=A0A8H5MEK4_9AGAR|nr:hypothetical protein D9757_003972 [Collybiopsis confluens]
MPSKVLVLHGYRECAYYTYRKIAPIIDACQNQVEFYFLDAPMLLMPENTLKSAPTCSTPTMHPTRSNARRAWFIINETGRDSLPGIEGSWSFLQDVLKQHTFDAILGFSQGAAMAEQIAAMLERPYLFPMFCENGIAPHPPLKFIACVSGFLIRGPQLSWESSYSGSKALMGAVEFGFVKNTPTLCVVGRNDIVVPLERSHMFARHSLHKRVEEHHGGHFIPMQTKWRQFFISFFLNPFAEIPSPSPPPMATTSAADDDEIVTPLPVRAEPYQLGQALPSVDGVQEELEEEQHQPSMFAVIYDFYSDSDSDSDSHISPPDTPFLRTPQLPVLELDEPTIVGSEMMPKYDSIDGVAGHFAGTVLAKSKL